MINYSEHIAPYTQKTDVEIAQFCSLLIKNPIKCESIRSLCASQGVVTFNVTTQRYDGPLWQFLVSTSLPFDLIKVARWFLQHVWIDQQDVIHLNGKSSLPGIISGFEVVLGFGALTQLAVTTNPTFSAVRTGIISLGGGLEYPNGITPEDVFNAKSAEQERLALLANRQAALEAAQNIYEQVRVDISNWTGGPMPSIQRVN